jgi:hypothetical protein
MVPLVALPLAPLSFARIGTTKLNLMAPAAPVNVVMALYVPSPICMLSLKLTLPASKCPSFIFNVP